MYGLLGSRRQDSRRSTLQPNALDAFQAHPTSSSNQNPPIIEGEAPVAPPGSNILPPQNGAPFSNADAQDGPKILGPGDITGASPAGSINHPPGSEVHDGVAIGGGSGARGQSNVAGNLQTNFMAAKNSRLWEKYVRMTEEEDKDLVGGWDGVIDVTLVFAALFSAILTGFVIESSKNLQTDQTEAAVSAIRDLAVIVQAGFNASLGIPLSSSPTLSAPDDAFQPKPLAIWVNCLWFLSLGLSISVSLFAMLAKRWCYVFKSKRFRVGTTYHERALKRQESWDAIERWKMELVIEQLPTLMHISLILFFVGLVLYLLEIHLATMFVVAVLVGCTLTVYFLLTVTPVFSQKFPMVTPFTRIVLAMTPLFTAIVLAMKLFKRAVLAILRPFAILLDFLDAGIGSFLMIMPTLSELHQRYKRLNRQDFLEFCHDLFKFCQTLFKSCQDTVNSIIQPVRSACLRFLRRTKRILDQDSIGVLSFIQQLVDPDDPDWVVLGYLGQVAKTKPQTRAKSNRTELRLLMWILGHYKDMETAKEVLEYISNFPGMIMDSSATSEELHTIVSMVIGHWSQFQHDTDWGQANHMRFRMLCKQLIELTTLPWLHESTHEGSDRWKILDLSKTRMYSRYNDSYYRVDGFDLQLQTLRDGMLDNHMSLIPQLEALVKELVLVHMHEPMVALKMCTDLGKLLIIEDPVPLQSGRTGVYSVLWWAFSCNILNWEGNEISPEMDINDTVTCHSALTLNYFNDSAKRQKSALWLICFGVSGILCSYARTPDPASRITADPNQEYFVELINSLRLAMCTPVTEASDPFVGELPVYTGTQVRLGEIDSLQYGIDALKCALKHSPDPKTGIWQRLEDLQNRFEVLQKAKSLFPPSVQPELDKYLSYDKIDRLYSARSEHPAIWLSSGVLRYAPDFRLDGIRARFLSKLLPDIIFGEAPSVPANQASLVEPGVIPCADPDKYAESSNAIATMAWMPFKFDPIKFRSQFMVGNPNYMHQYTICEALYRAGLLRLAHKFGDEQTFQEFMEANAEPKPPVLRPDALQWCLYIKARLLERLYAFRDNNHRLPNTLEWSITLAGHVASLLPRFNLNATTMNADEKIFTITLLGRLVNDLLDQNEHMAIPPQADTAAAQPPQTDPATAHNVQQNSPINPILGKLALHFPHFIATLPEGILDINRAELKTTSNRLGQVVAQLGLQGDAAGQAAGEPTNVHVQSGEAHAIEMGQIGADGERNLAPSTGEGTSGGT